MSPYYELLSNPTCLMSKYQCVVELFKLNNTLSMRLHQADALLKQELSGYSLVSESK